MLIANRHILYNGRLYNPGEELPENNAEMTKLWVEAKSVTLSLNEQEKQLLNNAADTLKDEDGNEVILPDGDMSAEPDEIISENSKVAPVQQDVEFLNIDIEHMAYKDLQELAKKRGIPSKQSANDLKEALKRS